MKLTKKNKKADRELMRFYTLNVVKHKRLYPLSMYDVNIYSFSFYKSCRNAKMGKLLLTCIFKKPVVPDSQQNSLYRKFAVKSCDWI